MLFPLSSHTVVFLKYNYPVVEDVACIPVFFPSAYLQSIQQLIVRCRSAVPFFLHVSLLLHLYSLEVYPGVYGVQLAVQGVERGSLGGLCAPAVHHYSVNIRRTAAGTGQPKPR